jgi:glycosyltransferase involved in cell wall biosynthesis
LEDEGADVVHVHASIFSAGALAGGWAAQSLGLPMVATVHSVLGDYAWVHRLAHGLTGWGSWAQVVAGVSPQVSAELSRVLERPTEVLDNAVDVDWWRAGPPPAPRGPGQRLRLITVQRLKVRKRGAALLDVLAGVQARLPAGSDVELVFVGDGPRRGALERKAARLGLSVRFLGALSREEVRRALASAHVFVMSSAEESFGLAAVEARAVGLPVVALRSGRLREIAPDGEAGLLVDNDHQMVEALTRLAGDGALLARLSEHSRRNPPRFDWARVARQHEEAYHRAMHAAGRSP